MTEYWVSQGKYWCEYCRIFLANNPASIRNHEVGQRHKESVTLRLAKIKKDTADKEREKREATKLIGRIEAEAKKQYDKDLAAQEKHLEKQKLQYEQAQIPGPPAYPPPTKQAASDWVLEESTGFYFNADSGYHYDANSGLYYTSLLGKWTTQEEALKASLQASQSSEQQPLANASASESAPAGAAPAPPSVSRVVSSTGALNIGTPKENSAMEGKKATPSKAMPVSRPPMKLNSSAAITKGVASAVAIDTSKRKRPTASGAISEKEQAAIDAREAARRRVAEKDKLTMGLYSSF